MTEIQLGIIKALSTVFFQEGFDRSSGKHGLEHWRANDLERHCRQCTIWENNNIAYKLNTVEINGQWCVRLYWDGYDEYSRDDRMKVLLYIPVNTERLCWDEMARCAQLISNCIE